MMEPHRSFRDSELLVISTDEQSAARSYASGLASLLGSSVDAEPHLRHAVAVDAQFALAWIALAIATGARGDEAECSACADRAAANLAGSTRRERQHIEVIRMLLAGDLRRAAVLGREHLREYPADALIAHVLASGGAI